MRGAFWRTLTLELHRRTEGLHESGAFLLGTRNGSTRTISWAVFYDELDPDAYSSGVCILHAPAFGKLWEICEQRRLEVVADVHVHGLGAGQSLSDRRNPMIARTGHLALILPLLATPPVRRWAIGIYEYLGDHEWRAVGGCNTRNVLKLDDQA
jgi:hypothetical protein